MSFELFDPGDNIETPVIIGGCKPAMTRTSVIFPGRIHMTPIDCNRFDFGIPGGGGYGFAIDMPNRVDVAVAAQDSVDGPEQQTALALHFVQVMRRALGCDVPLHIAVQLDPRMGQHFGLGSSAVLSCGLVWAINTLFGEPLTRQQCRDIVTANFVEGCQGRLARGLDTGVGTYVALHGGLVVVGDSACVAFATPVPEQFKVVVVDCGARRPDTDVPESMEMLQRSRELDSYYRYYMCYSILMDILPALHAGDWKRFGKLNWEFQFAGTHLSMLQGYYDQGIGLMTAMRDLRDAGAAVVGMSSVGPALYALTDDAQPIVDACQQRGYTCWVTQASNTGAVAVPMAQASV